MSDYETVIVELARGVRGKYWAIATWDGRQWQVRIEDYDEVHRGDTTADHLSQAAHNASVVLAAEFGCHPEQVDVSVEARLPTPIVASLKAAEGLVAQAAPHVESAVIGLRHAKVRDADIVAIVAARTLTAAPGQPPI